jgi:hypothetical protein
MNHVVDPVLIFFMQEQVLDSIVASIPACHAGDPGSIPGRGVFMQATIVHEILNEQNKSYFQIKL